jgi:hypothetical protein
MMADEGAVAPALMAAQMGDWPVSTRRTSARDAPDDEPAQTGDSLEREWLEEFEAAARRPLRTRMRYAFIKTYKPVLDDAPYRSFDTMEDYRRWCEENLPDWLGYGRI